MRQIIAILLFFGLGLHCYGQSYISLLDGTSVKSVDENSSTRNVEILDDGVLVTYNLKYVQAIQDPIYPDAYTLRIKGFEFNSSAGEPAILGRVDAFTLPVGTFAKISIESTEYIDLPMKISPARPLLSENTYEVYSKENVPTVKGYKGMFPESIVEYTDCQMYRGTPIAHVSVKPMQYNYDNSTARVYSKIKYKVTFINESKTISSVKIVSPDDYILRNTTLNQGLIKKMGKSERALMSSVDVTKDYLIITVPQFLDAVNRFAEWKKLMGYNVIVSTQSSWTYDDVLNEVQAQYDSCDNLYYYLIVGSQSLINSKYAGGNYYTDYYIGCMGGEFDYENDVIGGRLPVTTLNEANTVIDKIISYEKNPVMNYSFYNTGLNCTYFQDSNNDGYEDRRYARTTERIRNYMIAKGKTVNRVYYANSNVSPSHWINANDYYSDGGEIPDSLKKPNFPWDGNAGDIINRINAGAFYVLHRDHGEVRGWVEPKFDLTDIHQLNNGNMLPVFFNIDCETGRFCSTNPRCFADSLLVMSNGGAVGIFAASEYTKPQPNDALAEGIFETIWPSPGLMQDFNCQLMPMEPVYALGFILKEGTSKMISVDNWGHHKYNNREYYHCFGDPSMEIRTEYPSDFSSVTINRITNSVTVNLGSDSGRITFYNTATGLVTSYEGNSASYVGDAASTIVCIYGHNRIPYIDYPPTNTTYYIQNETVVGNKTISSDVIKAGSNVTDTKPQGPVTFNGGMINLNGGIVELHGETEVTLGTTLNINN